MRVADGIGIAAEQIAIAAYSRHGGACPPSMSPGFAPARDGPMRGALVIWQRSSRRPSERPSRRTSLLPAKTELGQSVRGTRSTIVSEPTAASGAAGDQRDQHPPAFVAPTSASAAGRRRPPARPVPEMRILQRVMNVEANLGVVAPADGDDEGRGGFRAGPALRRAGDRLARMHSAGDHARPRAVGGRGGEIVDLLEDRAGRRAWQGRADEAGRARLPVRPLVGGAPDHLRRALAVEGDCARSRTARGREISGLSSAGCASRGVGAASISCVMTSLKLPSRCVSGGASSPSRTFRKRSRTAARRLQDPAGRRDRRRGSAGRR